MDTDDPVAESLAPKASNFNLFQLQELLSSPGAKVTKLFTAVTYKWAK
jgi:hypothetical protein